MAVIFDSSWNVEHNFGRRPKMTTPPKFGQNWLSGFKEEDFFFIIVDGQTNDECKMVRKAHLTFYTR